MASTKPSTSKAPAPAEAVEEKVAEVVAEAVADGVVDDKEKGEVLSALSTPIEPEPVVSDSELVAQLSALVEEQAAQLVEFKDTAEADALVITNLRDQLEAKPAVVVEEAKPERPASPSSTVRQDFIPAGSPAYKAAAKAAKTNKAGQKLDYVPAE